MLLRYCYPGDLSPIKICVAPNMQSVVEAFIVYLIDGCTYSSIRNFDYVDRGECDENLWGEGEGLWKINPSTHYSTISPLAVSDFGKDICLAEHIAAVCRIWFCERVDPSCVTRYEHSPRLNLYFSRLLVQRLYRRL